MEDKSYCNCCINQGTEKCEGCYQTNTRNWTIHVNFYPKSEFRSFFYRGYIGDNSYEWMWNSTRCDRPATKSVVIHNSHYCPYCYNKMFPVQDSDTLSITRFICFCKGASAEIEYNQAKEELLTKHKLELRDLENKYKPDLMSNLTTLFNIKQEQDKKTFEFFHKDATCVGFYDGNIIDLEGMI